LERAFVLNEGFLSRVKNAQLTLRPTKCSVGFSSVSYLGHYVGNHSLQTKSDLVKKIPQAPKPTNTNNNYDPFWV